MIDIEEKEIPVSQLKLGMYVSRFDIPWEITRFPIQGLLIESQKDIDRLAVQCRTVFIDQTRSSTPLLSRRTLQSPFKPPRKSNPINTRQNQKSDWKIRHCVERYRVTVAVEKEVKESHDIFNAVERQLYLICEHTLRCRRAHMAMLLDSATQVAESVIRNPDAFAWLCRVRTTQKPIYMHTIRLAIWGAIAGRQLGLNTFSISHLCFALLMTGIGKSHLSLGALQGYSAKKTSSGYQAHIDETLYQLNQFQFASEDTLNTLRYYCERYDGSGYPKGIGGEAIPFLARASGLIETFELLVNPYDNSRAIAPANAITYLNKSKNVLFDAELVEAFTQAIGIYPTGTLVELSDSSLGVIFSQDYEKPLRAKVIPLVDATGHVIKKLRILELTCESKESKKMKSISIRKGLPSTSIPRGLIENAHKWMFNRDSRLKSWFRTTK